MISVFLDTSAYSAFFRGQEEVVEILGEAETISVNPIMVGELLFGFREGSRSLRNERTLEEFLNSPRVRLLPLDLETSRRYSVIRSALKKAGTPIPANDLWIAATAMQYGLEIVTTDAHFMRVPQVLVRWVSLPQ